MKKPMFVLLIAVVLFLGLAMMEMMSKKSQPQEKAQTNTNNLVTLEGHADISFPDRKK